MNSQKIFDIKMEFPGPEKPPELKIDNKGQILIGAPLVVDVDFFNSKCKKSFC